MFDRVEVRLPFFNRGCIASHSFRPTAGTATVAQRSHTVQWVLDKHFSGKQTAASLQADLTFDCTQRHGAVDDPFCTGLTAYADVQWSVVGKTLSSTHINSDTIRIQPPQGKGKVKVAVLSKLQAGDYRIWNTNGASRQCIPLTAQQHTEFGSDSAKA